MDTLHHVAIQTDNIAETVEWYRRQFDCRVDYQDDTWALLGFANIQLALVIPGQHPPHLAITRPDAAAYGPLTTHRDGTRSVYVHNKAGHTVEIMDAASVQPRAVEPA